MIHKTKVLTLIVFGLLFLNLSAQDGDFVNDKEAKVQDENRAFRLGLHVTPNISWFKANSTGYEGEGTKIGFSYGLSFERFLSKNYLISTGIDLLYAGGDLKYKGVTEGLAQNYTADVNQSLNLRYIELPIILKLRTNEIGYLTYFGQFGLKAGFNFKSNANYTYSYNDPFIPVTQTHNESVKGVGDQIGLINLSLVVGGGIEYSISGNTALVLGVTFNNGFINQLDKKENLLDANGNAEIDVNGDAILSEKGASANLNYFALTVGIYF